MHSDSAHPITHCLVSMKQIRRIQRVWQLSENRNFVLKSNDSTSLRVSVMFWLLLLWVATQGKRTPIKHLLHDYLLTKSEEHQRVELEPITTQFTRLLVMHACTEYNASFTKHTHTNTHYTYRRRSNGVHLQFAYVHHRRRRRHRRLF